MHGKAPCCGEFGKAVVVSVFVERPRRRGRVSSSPNRPPQRNYLRHHLHVRERITFHKASGGYDRRAELLLYSQHLREAARRCSVPGTPASHSHAATGTSSSTKKSEPQMTKILSLRRSTRKRPACLGDWKRLLIPGFLRSFAGFRLKKNKNKKSKGSPSDQMSVFIKSFEMKTKSGLISKLLSKFQKGR